jgi:nitroimidazol reductase NimA-like FMN-containing flavoprotein (pyridoxamine 5'-phosphate oxidase superfamily)
VLATARRRALRPAGHAVVRDIDIFPINFVVDGRSIVFRTAEGTKLLEMVISDLVAVEADHRDPAAGTAWSVVAKGSAEVLPAVG